MRTSCIPALFAALTAGAFAQTSAPAADTASAPEAAQGDAPYKVVDGYKVDPATLQGFRTWRAATCDRCHGAEQEGLVGPSLIAGMQRLSKEDFVDIVANGRFVRGVMPAYKTNKDVMAHMDELYAYLKGRSEGDITRAKVEAIDK
ncbi:cytochrome c [Methylibium sp.]|uniref:c-type cytochrome n=1 Tax=Methylibium sp. TaxID=2067992 RepID=UPI0017E5FE5C|nr:cytochrome c [Methylibium sp.]MBA3592015.1 c-type cytochrome [Methylibium sp.]